MAPSKKYVALAEVAKRWNRSEDEIICWANDCEFFLCSSQTLLQRDGSRYIGWVIIPPGALGGYLSGKNSIACSRFFRMEDQPPYKLQCALRMLKEKLRGDLVNCSELIYHSSPISAEEMKKTHPDLDQMPDASPLFEKEITIDRSSLHIHKDEIASMEKRYPELKPAPAHTDQTTLAGPYSLKEAAEESACSENEVIRIAISGKIDLRIKTNGWFQAYIRKVKNGEVGGMVQKCPADGYLAVWWQELLKFLPNHDEAEISEFKNVAVDKTKPGIGWRRYEKNCMGYRVDEDGNPSPVTVKRADLLIFGPDLLVLKKEVKAKRTEFLGIGVDQEEKNTKQKATTGNLSGRPKSPFGEAVEKAYRFFLESGNTEILKSTRRNDFRKSFIALLKAEDWTDKKNKEVTTYIAERIKGQKVVGGEICIEAQGRSATKGKNKKQSFPSKTYDMDDLSDELSKLRGKYPLPT